MIREWETQAEPSGLLSEGEAERVGGPRQDRTLEGKEWQSVRAGITPIS